ncbi:Na+/H+ antiporter NhaA [Phenylobacterium sp.]|jgi:NhaA family Na+:H+ antiporter|uniref:Na+/H+ antiporter NhaA n=1 Tax=Phenylobacterium sp. TaxID=1871053 RepID=UPI0037837184
MTATRPRSAMREFLRGEAASGILLMAAAAAGLLIANSPLAAGYFGLLERHVGPLSVLHWINDGLMAVFFMVVGLEVKRELVDGQLSTWPRRVLPGLAALGGMVIPAVIYLLIARDTPGALRGWATPAATDIAFTLGVLALLGRRAPVSLKVFVTALAIIDDLGAVAIIALFYTAELSLPWLGAAGAVLAGMTAMNRLNVRRLWPYMLGAALLWVCVLQSGVHASLAGVAAAMTVPLDRSKAAPDAHASPLHRLEHALHPWSAFLVVPVFGLANAGISLLALPADALVAPVTMGVALGLFLGKQVGVFASAWAAVRLGWADAPEDTSWAQVYGAALLCGIGFTMSLFIGLLAFPDAPTLQAEVKLGVLVGSLASALAGAAVLGLSGRPNS